MTSPPQERDAIAIKGFWLGAAFVFLVSAAFVLIAWGIDACQRAALRADEVPATWTTPPEEINAVEVAPFADITATKRDAVAELARLRSYGWVDRHTGVVHVPIERAMELYLSRQEVAP